MPSRRGDALMSLKECRDLVITARSQGELPHHREQRGEWQQGPLPPLWATRAIVQGGNQEMGYRGLGHVTGPELDS